MNARCFLLLPTGKFDRRLRRYHTTEATHPCPVHGYHNASVVLDVIAKDDDVHDWPKDDARWPKACDCGYVFTDADHWQLFRETVWRREDTGEEMTLRDAPPGAMWDADWVHGLKGFCGPDGHSIMCKLPDGHTWHIDGVCSNCTRPGEEHECWCRHGTPPLLTVDKTPNTPKGTCAAGAGSIASKNWHGFLRNGVLEQC